MKKIRCFVAGAKDQERQREILTSVLGNMQTKWNVMFETKSFVDFNGTLSSDGQQKDYNKYIMSKADIVVFVFDHNVGEKTIEEFVVAYKGLLSRNHPDILVFCNSAVKNDLNIQAMSLMLNQLKQYYIEYSTDKDLKHLFSEEIDKYIKRKKDKTFTDFYTSQRNYTIFWYRFLYKTSRSSKPVLIICLLYRILAESLFFIIKCLIRKDTKFITKIYMPYNDAYNFIKNNPS